MAAFCQGVGGVDDLQVSNVVSNIRAWISTGCIDGVIYSAHGHRHSYGSKRTKLIWEMGNGQWET